MTTKEKIEVMQAYENGEQIEGTPKYTNEWCELDEPVWDWDSCDYRIKPKPLTREEITAQWVKDNDVKLGDKVKNIEKGSHYFGVIGEVNNILTDCINVSYGEVSDCFSVSACFSVEYLKKVTPKIIKFTFEDREMFRDKWVRMKENTNEHRIIKIFKVGIMLILNDSFTKLTFDEALINLEFTNGKPFGRELWE